MKKRIIAALLALALSAPAAALAQVVVVDGYGTDENAAKKDAARAAVEQVVGTLIDSKTITQNAMVELDEIRSKSQGFVSNIQVLRQDTQGGLLHIRASVDVNTSPNAGLMSNLQMIMQLNDPRIAVAVLRQDAAGRISGHDAIAEAALNDRLLSLGFSHVIDPTVAASLQDAQLLRSIYDGSAAPAAIGGSLGADYLVIGRLRAQAQDISLPDGYGGYAPTLLKTGNATLVAKVIRFDTGELVGTFTTTAKGTENSNEMAEQNAIIAASGKAAAQLEEKFRHFSAKTGDSVEMQVFTADSEAISQLVRDLKSLSCVSNVYLREQSSGKAVISVETTESPSGLVDQLKKHSSLGMFVAGLSGSTVKLSVSR